MTAQYGIIGYPLGHTFSPGFFNNKFATEGIDATYQAFPIPAITDMPGLLRDHPQLRGLNVTIPYKQQVMPLLDEVTPQAAAVGAVNCIAIKDGRTIGHNTDIIGFRRSLGPVLQPWHDRALILGSGGAAKAVEWVFREMGIRYTIVSRTVGPGRLTYDDLVPQMIQACKLVVNTTPLGMHPDTDSYPPIPYEGFTPQHLAYDLVYNPAHTQFLQRAAAYGAITRNGLEMLHLQALAGWEIWNS